MPEGQAMNNQTEVARKGSDVDSGVESKERTASSGSALRPAVDIFETDDGITLLADMPGVSKDRLNLRVDGANLLVEGTIGISPQEQMQALYADVRAATYRRTFLLSNELEADKIEANLRDGVLTLHIPKRAELRPRRIEVRAG
jgi:HSP20 family molecular chaperone IbpA